MSAISNPISSHEDTGNTFSTNVCDMQWDVFEDDTAEQESVIVCPHCGKANHLNQQICGEGEWDGCGGSLQ